MPEDLEHLARLQEEYQRASRPLADVLAELVDTADREGRFSLALSSRAKTSGTIIAKVGRGTRLSTMQDVFGFRVSAGPQPGAFTLSDQDRFAAALTGRFQRTKVVDRRVRPSSGYRAVHLIPEIDGFPIEVQVRTYLQDVWANETEALADAWGRGVRYGKPPEGRSEEEVALRSEVVELNVQIADLMYDWERAADYVQHRMADEILALGPAYEEAVKAAVRERVAARMDPVHDALVGALTRLRAVRERIG